MLKRETSTSWLKELLPISLPYACISCFTLQPRSLDLVFPWIANIYLFSSSSLLWVHPPALWTQGVLRSLRDLKLGLPYGRHPPCIDQSLLSVTAWSSSSILASWHLSFQDLFLHLYWLSLMCCMRTFSWVVSMYSNILELCSQGHCNYNTSLYENV